MRRVSSFAFGASTFSCTLPTQPWNPCVATVGGSRTAASGTPAAYLVRHDALLDATLRIEESEWTAFDNFISYGMSKQSILWTPDILEPGTTFEVYLESPTYGTDWSPNRNSEYPRMFEMAITIRGKGLVVPWLAYFTDD